MWGIIFQISKRYKIIMIKNTPGNSLALQWLGLSVFTVEAWVLSWVRELRSHKQQHGQKKKKNPILAEE